MAVESKRRPTIRMDDSNKDHYSEDLRRIGVGQDGYSVERDRELGAVITSGREARRTLEAESDLSRAERKALEAAVENGILARNELAQRHLRFALKMARQYERAAVSSVTSRSDLVQAANIGLMEAAERFDPVKLDARGTFLSFARMYVANSLRKTWTANSRAVGIPEHKNAEILRVRRVAAKLESELQRRPTVEELVAETGYTEDRIADCLELSQRDISEHSTEGEEDLWVTSSLDRLQSESAADASERERTEVVQLIVREILEEHIGPILDEREQFVLAGYFGLLPDVDALDTSVLATMLDRHPERIRQMRSEILEKIRAAGIMDHLRARLAEALEAI